MTLVSYRYICCAMVLLALLTAKTSNTLWASYDIPCSSIFRSHKIPITSLVCYWSFFNLLDDQRTEMYYNWCQVTGGILSMENWYGLSPLFKWRFSKNLWILINFRASSLNWDETHVRLGRNESLKSQSRWVMWARKLTTRLKVIMMRRDGE